MTDLDDRCLDTFPEWLRSLASDATDLAGLLASPESPEAARRSLAGGLNYLFKSLDLIPDGIEDLGFLDDAFVLRVAASFAAAESPELRDQAPTVARLARDAELIAELLGADHARLKTYVRSLEKGAARGRTVDDILGDEQVRTSFMHEIAGWASSYTAPTFSRDAKNLIKLKSFLSAKLPA
ncbi:DUF1232 domain-containing protein [Sorangium sp. So ce388]|uniref:DUF1232 domain-containing protein n=1 Tax=Sorangium sp. So ce388 TaxID=3133309 RepID=UPI003F5B752B